MDHFATGQRPIAGRGPETAAVDGFLAAVGDGFAALVLEGEAGIGKTAVWLEGLGAARGRGDLVLATRPGPAEATFSFAGLGDLLDGVLEQVRDELPAPQRHALDVALLRAPAGRRAPDHRAVAVAALSAL